VSVIKDRESLLLMQICLTALVRLSTCLNYIEPIKELSVNCRIMTSSSKPFYIVSTIPKCLIDFSCDYPF
jgi:hypothetical protein